MAKTALTRHRRLLFKLPLTLRPVYLQVEYEKCAERIEAKGQGNCAGQYMDYIACADQCAKDAIFKALK